MTITFNKEFLVWFSFFALFLIHAAIAGISRLDKDRSSAVGGSAFMHAIVTIMYAAFYPVWFPQGIAS